MDSPFDVLGVDPDADDDEIRDAYRERVKEAHPDHGGTKREFQLVRTAYEQLKAGGADGAEVNGDSPSDGETVGWPDSVVADHDPEPDTARVEYLNYSVLSDHGWDLDDEDLFEKAADADLDAVDHGEFEVGPDDSLLEAAEACGFAWPYACRGGACTNCAVMVVEGEMPTPDWQILPPELIDRGIRLSCNSAPTSDELKVIYNVKHLPGVDELVLPASRFEKARSDD